MVLAGIADRAASAHDGTRTARAEVALPTARALVVFARGDLAGCVRDLSSALPRLHKIGGSHVQRDLFEQILIASLLATGRLAQAQRMLALRHALNPKVPITQCLRARLLAAAGMPFI